MTYETFLVGMMKTPDAKLHQADIAKLAEKHGVTIEWAKMTVKHWLDRAA
jgi:hypothetical protein